MRLLHYSHKPFTFSRRHVYRDAGAFKPTGFWLSVEGEADWPEWCRAEMPEYCGKHVYKVSVKESARILHLSTVQQLDLFAAQYGCSSIPELPNRRHDAIDWPRVQAEYDGLIIAPYQYARRLAPGFLWYYSWDCASGVIWNLEAVENVKALEGAMV